ncbi:MAG: tyrosine--tRNA ligase [Dehalococcoidia bacterium]
MLKMDKLINKILTRGVEEIIPKEEFIENLNKNKNLRLKMGFDPSAPDIHLGHSVGLRKLRQLQDLGHTVVLIVADWTAQIGDPSGRSDTRPMLTYDEVKYNAETYLKQFFKIVDKSKTEIRWQSEWYGEFKLKNIINLTSKFTIAQFLARDDFSKRFKANHPITITEFLYPILQAYDSVVIKSDVEFGGTDQKFNLLVGRDLQQKENQKPQQCFLVQIIPGTDGKRKMSKSLNNYIGVTESPAEIYGKLMSIPDDLVKLYMLCLTDIKDSLISDFENSLNDSNGNPMEYKKLLAHDIVTQYYNAEDANLAEEHFRKSVQEKIVTYERIQIDINDFKTDEKLSKLLINKNIVSSNSEFKRLLKQNGVKLNGGLISEDVLISKINSDDKISIGKRTNIQIII